MEELWRYEDPLRAEGKVLCGVDEAGLLSDADLYYIVNSILSETIDIVLEWEGSTEYLQTYLRAAVVEPIERAYKAAIESLVEDMGLNGMNGLDGLDQ